MEQEVCMYQKYGFCKYRENCSKIHLKIECKDASCKSKRSCDKRHPKVCKRFILEEGCTFGQDCDYLHEEKVKSNEELKLKRRLEEL